MHNIFDKQCEECEGTGYVTCPSCGGDGKTFWPGVSGKKYPCMKCGASGKIECETCNGRGSV